MGATDFQVVRLMLHWLGLAFWLRSAGFPFLGKIFFILGRFFSEQFLPPAIKLEQGYVFTRICDSVPRGVCLSACWDKPPPGADPPPQEQAPLGPDPPGADNLPRDQSPQDETRKTPPGRNQEDATPVSRWSSACCEIRATSGGTHLLECILVNYFWAKNRELVIFW